MNNVVALWLFDIVLHKILLWADLDEKLTNSVKYSENNLIIFEAFRQLERDRYAACHEN